MTRKRRGESSDYGDDYEDEVEYIDVSLLKQPLEVQSTDDIYHDSCSDRGNTTTEDTKRIHGCQECSKKFKTKKELLIHMRVHTNERPFKCNICEKAFKQTGALKDHMISHTGQRNFQCKICNGRFTTQSSKKRHIIRVHGQQKSFGCSICDDSFFNKADLTKHKEDHFRSLNLSVEDIYQKAAETGVYTCPLCDRRFKKKDLIFLHLDSHSENLLKCEYCEETYTYLNLKTHIRKKHSIIKCSLCDRDCVSLKVLALHERDHFKLPSDSCDYCSKIFDNELLLQDHMKEHSKGTHFKCKFCLKLFAEKKHLCIHQTVAHFKCNECRIFFASKVDKILHFKREHLTVKQLFKCKLCKARFYPKTRLAFHMNSVHLKLTPFKCKFCQMEFQRYRLLERHLIVKHKLWLGQKDVYNVPLKVRKVSVTKKYSLKCTVCEENGKATRIYHYMRSLNNHIINIHSELAPQLVPSCVRCPQCPKLFLTLRKMNEHVRQHFVEADEKKLEEFKGTTCNQCLVSFFCARDLNRHNQEVHSIYYCSRCRQYYRNSEALKQHKMSHKGRKNTQLHSCYICERTFSSGYYLNIHIGKEHIKSGDKSLKCKHCSYSSMNKSRLLHHMYRKHRSHLPSHIVEKYDSEKVKCHVCSFELSSEMSLRRHMRVHENGNEKPIECPHCKKQFKTKSGLKTHERNMPCLSLRKKGKKEKVIVEESISSFITDHLQ